MSPSHSLPSHLIRTNFLTGITRNHRGLPEATKQEVRVEHNKIGRAQFCQYFHVSHHGSSSNHYHLICIECLVLLLSPKQRNGFWGKEFPILLVSRCWLPIGMESPRPQRWKMHSLFMLGCGWSLEGGEGSAFRLSCSTENAHATPPHPYLSRCGVDVCVLLFSCVCCL